LRQSWLSPAGGPAGSRGKDEKERLVMDKELMWFFDEPSEDYQNFRKEAQALEKEYLELRRLLQEAEKNLKAEPGNADLRVKVDYLAKRIKGLEEKFPWLASGLMLEYALWGTPH
jgi:hypothetical protein